VTYLFDYFDYNLFGIKLVNALKLTHIIHLSNEGRTIEIVHSFTLFPTQPNTNHPLGLLHVASLQREFLPAETIGRNEILSAPPLHSNHVRRQPQAETR
jgi:hypothetical protein